MSSVHKYIYSVLCKVSAILKEAIFLVVATEVAIADFFSKNSRQMVSESGFAIQTVLRYTNEVLERIRSPNKGSVIFSRWLAHSKEQECP